jgi:hypothetical protein
LEAHKIVSQYTTVKKTDDFVGLEVDSGDANLVNKSITYEIAYEVLSLDGIIAVHSVYRDVKIKFTEAKCSKLDFTMPDFSEGGIQFTLFSDEEQYVDINPDFGNEDVSKCSFDFSFVGATHLSSLEFVDSKLYFDRMYEGNKAHETVMGARIQLCIAEGNCRETEAFTLQITNPCRTATIPKEDIGKIATQTVPYLGSKSVKISTKSWSNSVSKSINTALFAADPICGDYSYDISSCDDSECSTYSPTNWTTASTDQDGGVFLSFDATEE